jgi:5-methyltetrahydrofolate--homocysteine methyltransferase
MVGGAPVTQEYADAVGADAYSADASSAVKKAKELLSQRGAPLPA